MKISPIINFSFIQTRKQNTVNSPLHRNIGLQTDVVSFSRNYSAETPKEKIKKLVPKHKGLIYKKVKDRKDKTIKKVPIKVDIEKSDFGSFDFIHKGKRIGYVILTYIPEDECINEICDYEGSEFLHKNYKDEGVVGDRIEVGFVYNCDEDKYGGIGHLADLIEVAACKELGFEPNVISASTTTAAPIHYKRGKRFIPFEKYCTDDEMKRYKLIGKDPNKIVQKIIKKTPKGEEFNTSSIKIEPLMYMPKEMIQELEEELEKHPIF